MSQEHPTHTIILNTMSSSNSIQQYASAEEIRLLQTNLAKATEALKSLKDWSDTDAIPRVGPSGLYSLLHCICDKTDFHASNKSRHYPKYDDEHMVDEDLLKGCLSVCQKQAHFQNLFTPSGLQRNGSINSGGNFTLQIEIICEWETKQPLSMDENICIRLMNVLYAVLMTKPVELLPRLRAMGGFPLILSLVTKPDASITAKMQFTDMVMNLCDQKEFLKGFGDELFGVLASFVRSPNSTLRSFASQVLSKVTQAAKHKTVKRSTKMEDFTSLVDSITGRALTMDNKREVIMGLEDMMKSDEMYKDALAQRGDVFVGLFNEVFASETSVEDAVLNMITREEQKKQSRRGHDPKYWLTYVTIASLSTAAVCDYTHD